jgi:type VI secretion system protein ImpC
MSITSDPDRTEIEQPDTHKSREESFLPFRMLLVSDLTPQAPAPDWAEKRCLHRVDKNSFAEFMTEMAPQLSLEVPNAISDSPRTWTLDLEFPELQAFTPEAVARQAHPTAPLLEIRALIKDIGRGAIDLETFQQRINEVGIDEDWAADLYQTLAGEDDARSVESAESGEDESLDRLLGMVDAENDKGPDPGTESSPAATNGDAGSSRFIDALMNSVTGESAGSEANPAAVDMLVTNITTILTAQVESIVENSGFRQLEAAWRGLKFLVDRLNFREDVQLVVLPAGRNDLHEAMHHQVIVPEHSPENDEPPVSLILIDDGFGRGHLDIERLSDLAGTGHSLQTPVIASADASFFGVKKISGLARLPALRPHLRGDKYVEWEALCDQDEAQFLGLTLPSFLLRRPYRAGHHDGSIPVDEAEGLMGSGALAVGVAAAQSFTDTGWPTHLDNYEIENLPVHAVRGGESPLAALLPGSKKSELARAGFIVLGGRTDHDAIRVTHASMVRRPETYDNPSASAEARAHVSLPCRLFVTRAAHYLLTLQAGLEGNLSIEDVRQEVQEAMASFLGVPLPPNTSTDENDEPSPLADESPAIVVDHVTNVDLPEQELFAVRLAPPPDILKPNVRLVMGLQISLPA